MEFRAIYDEHVAYVWRTMRRLGVHERDIEDVSHDAFVAFFRGRASYDPARPIRPWLFGIALHVASDYRRRAQHRLEIPDDDPEVSDPAGDTEARLAAREIVLAGLEVLDLDRRAVLVMHDLDGHSMPEIAEALAVPLNTLYSRLRLAREQFAQAVRSHTQRGAR